MRRSEKALWAGAFGASIMLHAALGAALALAPRPERKDVSATTIAIQSVARDAPDAVAATPVAEVNETREQVAAVSDADVVVPAQSRETPTAVGASVDSLAASEIATAVEPVHEAEIAIREEGPRQAMAGVEESAEALQPAADGDAASSAAAPLPADQAAVMAQPVPASDLARSVAASIGPAEVPPSVTSRQVVLPAEAITPVANGVGATGVENPAVAAAEAVLAESRETPVIATSRAEILAAAPARPEGAAIDAARTASGLAVAGPAAVPTAATRVVPPAAAQVAAPSGGGGRDTTLVAVASTPTAAAAPPDPVAATAVGTPSPELPDSRVAMLPVTPRQPVLQASPAVDALQQVRNVIAGQPERGCFLALATPAPQSIDVDGYSETRETLQQLHRDLAVISDAAVNTRQHRITAAQCEALSFARARSPDTVAQMPITSASAEISSGAELTGAIHNFSRKWLYLVVVDDEGKVQELNDLTRNGDGSIGFRAPFTLTDGPVDTVQLLLAVASDSALETFERHEGENARSYFAALAEEIAALGDQVTVGIAGFVIR